LAGADIEYLRAMGRVAWVSGGEVTLSIPMLSGSVALRLRLERLEMKVLNLLLGPWLNELSIEERVEVKPPVDRLSMNGFMKGIQEMMMAALSCMVVARYAW
jgi:hypothetical protein